MCQVTDCGKKLGVSDRAVFVGAVAAAGVKEDPLLHHALWMQTGKPAEFVTDYCIDVLSGRKSTLLGKAESLRGGVQSTRDMHDLNCD